jgi:hypothetical protein
MHSILFPRALLVSVVLFAAAGCSSVPMDSKGEVHATYVAGEFRALVNATAPATARATSEAFRQLGLFEIQNELESFQASLGARTPSDERVRVSIKEVNSRQTQVGIRVDIVGDKEYSRKLFEQIDRNLAGSGGTTPAAW